MDQYAFLSGNRHSGAFEFLQEMDCAAAGGHFATGRIGGDEHIFTGGSAEVVELPDKARRKGKQDFHLDIEVFQVHKYNVFYPYYCYICRL